MEIKFIIIFVSHQYDNGIFRSNAEALINAVPVIEVNGITAVV